MGLFFGTLSLGAGLVMLALAVAVLVVDPIAGVVAFGGCYLGWRWLRKKVVPGLRSDVVRGRGRGV